MSNTNDKIADVHHIVLYRRQYLKAAEVAHYSIYKTTPSPEDMARYENHIDVMQMERLNGKQPRTEKDKVDQSSSVADKIDSLRDTLVDNYRKNRENLERIKEERAKHNKKITEDLKRGKNKPKK